MLLIIALVIASLFVYFLKDKLKQYPNIFYIGAAVVTIVIFSLRTVAMPQFVRQNIVGIFAKGTIGTAFFIIVMITGALPRGSKLIGPLMRIRGELSIMAAILVLSHNLTYGMTYFKMLFSAPAALPAVQRCAAVCSGDQSDADCIDDWINGDFISGSPQKDESEKVEADSAERLCILWTFICTYYAD